jgi:hypothetical protein
MLAAMPGDADEGRKHQRSHKVVGAASMGAGGSSVKKEVVGATSKKKWWEQRQKRSGQSFYGCDDVAGVTYVRPRGCDIIADYPPTLTSPQQL